MCFERDANTLYVCEPSAGGCDTAGEWTATGGGAATSLTVGTNGGEISQQAAGTPDQSGFWTGTTGNAWLIAENADKAFDFAHAAATDPTLFIHSNAQSTTHFLALRYSEASGDAEIVIGSGGLLLTNAATTNASFRSNGELRLLAGIGIGFVASDVTAGLDTYFERSAAGVAKFSGTSSALGYVLSGVPVEANTGTKATTVGESGELYTNTGDGDGSTVTLVDNPTVGATFRVAVTVAQTITVAPSTGESLYDGIDQCVVSLTSNAVGSTLEIIAVSGGSGALWFARKIGTWTCND
jgi:hypothetical protein